MEQVNPKQPLPQKTYQCPECGFHYTDEPTAKKCQAWCREHNSCNIEITKVAIENRTL
jgi:hypothetical protein